MNPSRRRLTIAQVMIGVAVCAIVIKWPVLLIPATLGLVMGAVQYRWITMLELLVLVLTFGCCLWLWLIFFPGTRSYVHGRPIPFGWWDKFERLAVSACVIVEGGIVYWLLRRRRLRRRSVEGSPTPTTNVNENTLSS
jgi:hypothetical protein